MSLLANLSKNIDLRQYDHYLITYFIVTIMLLRIKENIRQDLFSLGKRILVFKKIVTLQCNHRELLSELST